MTMCVKLGRNTSVYFIDHTEADKPRTRAHKTTRFLLQHALYVDGDDADTEPITTMEAWLLNERRRCI